MAVAGEDLDVGEVNELGFTLVEGEDVAALEVGEDPWKAAALDGSEERVTAARSSVG